MGNRRLLRVADLLREELSDIIRRSVHDPRVTDQDFTILRVAVTPDLAQAHVHVSTLLEEPARSALIAGLDHAAGFIHRELKLRIRLKTVPTLEFEYDGGLAQSQHINDLLNSLKREREPGE
jgi:ribosome-binding factor A